MTTRDRHERPALVQALEGIGLVAAVSAGVWAVAAAVAFIVSLVF
jgi:hypothetical protein